MTTESNRLTQKPMPNERIDELKASDFFPPGEGWNHEPPPLRKDIIDLDLVDSTGNPLPRDKQH